MIANGDQPPNVCELQLPVLPPLALPSTCRTLSRQFPRQSIPYIVSMDRCIVSCFCVGVLFCCCRPKKLATIHAIHPPTNPFLNYAELCIRHCQFMTYKLKLQIHSQFILTSLPLDDSHTPLCTSYLRRIWPKTGTMSECVPADTLVVLSDSLNCYVASDTFQTIFYWSPCLYSETTASQNMKIYKHIGLALSEH